MLLTVDAEPDCPPFLHGWRGMTEGFPRLLELLDQEDVRVTCFTTGETAERFPDAVRALVAAGHELGCHGHTHRSFGAMTTEEAKDELARSSAVLRAFADVRAFRAPNLNFPNAFLPLLVDAGYQVDSSEGAHRLDHRLRPDRGATTPGLKRIQTSTTSSVLRLPPALRDPWLARLKRPAVLFIHPWELVDLRGEKIRWDCRAGTGPRALAAVREVIRLFKGRGARFGKIAEWAGAA